jgi:DNA polymerase-3 subunit epsilon
MSPSPALAGFARSLAARLTLDRPLVCLDLEATGIWVESDRIVQIALTRITPDGALTEWDSLVNPEQPIPAETSAVHGITDADVVTAPTFAQLVPTLTDLLRGCDMAGYNVHRFDRKLLAAEFRRASAADPTAGARIIDAYTIFVRQEQRSLDAALHFYGVAEAIGPRRAHDARSDVEATVAVLAAQLETYSSLPASVADLHAWLHPRGADWIDDDGKLVWKDGVATVMFGSGGGKALADLAATDRGFLEWVLRKDFSDQVKRVVRDALEGRFPVRPVTTPVETP